MSHPGKKPNSGFTLVELLIVISIISLLMQMLFPAIQSVREAARRTHCLNNLRNLGLAVQLYESSYGTLPPSHISTPDHNCFQYLLPYMEQQAVHDLYSFNEDWDSDRNRPATDMELNTLRCASAPADYPFVSDYAVCVQVDTQLVQEMADEGLVRERTNLIGLLRSSEERTLAAITDGLSNTILFCEMAGTPDLYRWGELTEANVVPGSRWGDNEARFSVSSRSNGSKFKTGSQLMNASNSKEIYSFHTQGANFAIGDGSVRFIAEDIDPDALVSFITAAEGD